MKKQKQFTYKTFEISLTQTQSGVWVWEAALEIGHESKVVDATKAAKKAINKYLKKHNVPCPKCGRTTYEGRCISKECK